MENNFDELAIEESFKQIEEFLYEDSEKSDKELEEEKKKAEKELKAYKRHKLAKKVGKAALTAGTLTAVGYGAYKLDKHYKEKEVKKTNEEISHNLRDTLKKNKEFEAMRKEQKEKAKDAKKAIKDKYYDRKDEITNKDKGLVGNAQRTANKVLFGKGKEFDGMSRAERSEAVKKSKERAQKAIDKVNDTLNSNLDKIDAEANMFNNIQADELKRLHQYKDYMMSSPAAGLKLGAKNAQNLISDKSKELRQKSAAALVDTLAKFKKPEEN